MKKTFLIAFVVLLFGCASPPKKIEYDCPGVVLPNIPKLPISALNKQSTPPDVMKAYVASVVAMNKWSEAVMQQVGQLPP